MQLEKHTHWLQVGLLAFESARVCRRRRSSGRIEYSELICLGESPLLKDAVGGCGGVFK